MKHAVTKLVVLGLAAMGFAACTTLPAEPASPTFAKDVQPIFAAHCTRCHGGGGMLRKEMINGVENPAGVIECYLDQMDARGDCSLVDGGLPSLAQCMPGVAFCATTPIPGTTTTLFDLFFFGAAGTARRMPPPPAPELNDWEMNTIRRWVAAGAPP
jgi:hypothetical protein